MQISMLLYLLGMSLLGPLLRSLMELRTELLAVSCVGDFISCQPRILLRFKNISNTIHDIEKKCNFVIVRRSYILGMDRQKLLIQKKNILCIDKNNIYIYYIKFYLEFYLDSPFILIIVVVCVTGFFRRWPRGR